MVLKFILDCSWFTTGASDIMEKIVHRLVYLENALEDSSSTKGSNSIERSVSQESLRSKGSNLSNIQASNAHIVRVKLPKINLQNFSGSVKDWQEFLDSFKSAIHDSPVLPKVDKFKYLRSYLEAPVRKVIGVLSLTDADYDSASEILKNRYARPTQIKRAHISQLLKLPVVYSVKNIKKLRQFDDIETNFRSPEALGADRSSYSSVIVPALLEKIPSP